MCLVLLVSEGAAPRWAAEIETSSPNDKTILKWPVLLHMLLTLLGTYRALGRTAGSRITMASISPPIGSGVALRRSSRLSRVESVKTIGTDHYAVQRREMAVTVNIRDEYHDLDTPTSAQIRERAEEGQSSPGEEKKSKTRRRKKESEEVQATEDGSEADSPKKRRKRQPKAEPEYIIPDVERKETTFKGRLGYACLNTVLRNKKPARESVFCSRTCRLESINKHGLDWVKDLGRQNVRDLITMIQWNEDNGIRFLRLSSEMFPFASHEKHGYSLEYCKDLLKEAGDLAKRYGHRLTTHPGQFTQLGSPRDVVRGAAVRELNYHCQMLDLMGVGVDGVMVVHGGGTYGDKASAIGRLKQTITEQLAPHVRARLVLENDEMCYNAEELLPLCEELDVPLVFDYHHDVLNPSSIPPSEIIKRADAIWRRRGIRPKQHISEPRPGAVTLMERRAHADRCETLPVDLPDDMDLMVEAKDKEQAVFHLYRIYGIAPVIHANLRPPNPNPSKETNGRKSTKRTTRSKVAGLGGDEVPNPQDMGDELGDELANLTPIEDSSDTDLSLLKLNSASSTSPGEQEVQALSSQYSPGSTRRNRRSLRTQNVRL